MTVNVNIKIGRQLRASTLSDFASDVMPAACWIANCVSAAMHASWYSFSICNSACCAWSFSSGDAVNFEMSPLTPSMMLLPGPTRSERIEPMLLGVLKTLHHALAVAFILGVALVLHSSYHLGVALEAGEVPRRRSRFALGDESGSSPVGFVVLRGNRGHSHTNECGVARSKRLIIGTGGSGIQVGRRPGQDGLQVLFPADRCGNRGTHLRCHGFLAGDVGRNNVGSYASLRQGSQRLSRKDT